MAIYNLVILFIYFFFLNATRFPISPFKNLFLFLLTNPHLFYVYSYLSKLRSPPRRICRKFSKMADLFCKIILVRNVLRGERIMWRPLSAAIINCHSSLLRLSSPSTSSSSTFMSSLLPFLVVVPPLLVSLLSINRRH